MDVAQPMGDDPRVVWLLFGCAAVVALGAFVFLAYRHRWRWTGFVSGPDSASSAGRTSKSLWDWLQLLIVPVALALAAFALNTAQDRRDRQREDDRAARAQASADDRTREDALRDYLQQMSNLITQHRLRSVRAELNRRPTDAQTLARTSTFVVLRRLDADRRGVVVQFLYEAGLLSETRHWEPKRGPLCGGPRHQHCWRPSTLEGFLSKVRLEGADLRGAVLRGQRLLRNFAEPCRDCGGLFLQEVESTNLSGADLRNADLRNVDARGVDFDGADLRGADFSGAFLAGATFNHACLTGARFDHARLGQNWPDLRVPDMPAAYLGTAEGEHVDFEHASLDRVDFRLTALTDIDLLHATLKDTMFPREWTRTGQRLSHKRVASLCESFAR